MSQNLRTIHNTFNSYYGVFLNLNCSLSCEYCVQKITAPAVPTKKYPIISGRKWVESLNSLKGRRQKRFLRQAKRKKISITGGEPTLHPDFAYIINNLDNDWNITVTSNLCSPFYKDAALLKQIKRKNWLKFNFSYHFLYMPIEKFIENLQRVKKTGLFTHNVFIVAHPAHSADVKSYRKRLRNVHPLVKLQRFTGYDKDKLYPNESGCGIEYQQQDGIRNYCDYREGFGQRGRQDIFCRMHKVLFAPNGDIYNCHYKLYAGHSDKLGNILQKGLDINVPQDYFLCHDYGFCNPCDAEGHAYKGINNEAFNISF